MRQPVLAGLMIALVTLCFHGCAGDRVYLVTTGFHAPFDHKTLNKKFRFVVWSNHPGVGNAIIGWVQENGHTVVERAHLQQVFDEQKIRLTHTSDDDADVLRVGQLIGAERVIFADVTSMPATVSQMYVGRYGGGGRSETVYHVSVAVRAVNVETGEVRWSGTAQWFEPMHSPDLRAILLAWYAIDRANCQIESGYAWEDPSERNTGGCKKNE